MSPHGHLLPAARRGWRPVAWALSASPAPAAPALELPHGGCEQCQTARPLGSFRCSPTTCPSPSPHPSSGSAGALGGRRGSVPRGPCTHTHWRPRPGGSEIKPLEQGGGRSCRWPGRNVLRAHIVPKTIGTIARQGAGLPQAPPTSFCNSSLGSPCGTFPQGPCRHQPLQGYRSPSPQPLHHGAPSGCLSVDESMIWIQTRTHSSAVCREGWSGGLTPT